MFQTKKDVDRHVRSVMGRLTDNEVSRPSSIFFFWCVSLVDTREKYVLWWAGQMLMNLSIAYIRFH